ncbi:MAG: hypothetical protein R6U61_08690, partial [Thermoplasmata archaeon]
MFAVSSSINQSRPHRVRAKTLGMCVKGAGAVSSGLNNLILFTFLNNDNSTSISTLSSDVKTNQEVIYENLNNSIDLVNEKITGCNLFEYEYNLENNYQTYSTYQTATAPQNISKQFNPIYQNPASGRLGESEAFPVDAVDVYQPQIVTDNEDGGLDVQTKDSWTGTPGVSTRTAWAEISLTAYDSAGIDYVVFKNKDNQKSVKMYLDEAIDNNDGTFTFETDLDIQYWNDFIADGWDLKVKIVDVNGNEFEKETHIQSQFGNFLDIIGLGWIGEALSEAWEAAKELADMFMEFVKSIIENAIKPLFEPILTAIYSYVDNLVGFIALAYETGEYNEEDLIEQ